MKFILSDDYALHRGACEPSSSDPSLESPERVAHILNRLTKAGFERRANVRPVARDELLDVHTPDYLDFLEHIWTVEVAELLGDKVLRPFAFAGDHVAAKADASPYARLGRHSFDVGAPILEGTWAAALSSASSAVTGVDAITAGEGAIFSLCRPPGHHATSDRCGGYCYLNNAAIAASAYVKQRGYRISILDIDYHHGNGTQDIFYKRADVQFVSLHGDPAFEYPFFSGTAAEIGEGDGRGFTHNFPLPRGTAWAGYRPALEEAIKLVAGYKPDVLVVSLGVDGGQGDPLGSFTLQSTDFRQAGVMLAGLGLPTHFLMEGGYALPNAAEHVTATLDGFRSGRT